VFTIRQLVVRTLAAMTRGGCNEADDECEWYLFFYELSTKPPLDIVLSYG